MSDTVEARLDRLEASAKVDAAILRDHIARLLALESAPKPPTPGSPCDDCTAGDAVKVLEEERRHRQDAARGWEAALARAEKAEAALSDSRIEREELSRALAVQEQENNHLRAEAAHAQKRVAALERDLSNTAGSYHEVKAALSEAQRAGDAIVVKLREKCEELERERDEAREAWRLWCATCLPGNLCAREGCGHRRDEHITANRRGVGAECLAEVIGEVDDLCACMEFVEPSVSAKGCAR